MKFNRQHSIQTAIDIVAINLAWLGALILRFDARIPAVYFHNWLTIALVITVIRIGTFVFFRLYQSLWSYSSIPEFFLVIKAVTVSTLMIWILALTARQLGWLPFATPKAIGIIDWLLNIALLSCIRFAIRFKREWHFSQISLKNRTQKKLLIIGAGEAGSLILKEILIRFSDVYAPLGFIDDDLRKRGHSLHGLPILGTREDIPRLIGENQVEEIIIALPSASRKDTREILEICQQHNAVHILIVPAVAEIINGDVTMKHLRDVAIEDLLGRDPIETDLSSIAGYLSGERILITGAGGSIGSELCRQIARFEPKSLILLGHGENSIYDIEQELKVSFPELPQIPVIADIRDREKLAAVFRSHQPTIVFHAAAHKHVPLMEREPDEAIKTNIFGTKNLAELADEHHCKRFVFISTDKAVNPTSVMGATKRVAELIIQDINTRSKTKYMAVRFGNVLGSRGSVVPLFRQQITRGGPVTVTHPDMTRFFMTIPEAVQLVMQAGALGNGGEVFILDMGEPVKIVDLAREIIRLSGFVPEKDIKIEFTGIRPGEKMYEELLHKEEGTQMTRHERIFSTKTEGANSEFLDEQLDVMEACLKEGFDMVRAQLQKMVKEYQICEGMKGYKSVS